MSDTNNPPVGFNPTTGQAIILNRFHDGTNIHLTTYTSSDMGANWVQGSDIYQIAGFDINLYLKGISYNTSANRAIAIYNSSDTIKAVYTVDGGVTWEETNLAQNSSGNLYNATLAINSHNGNAIIVWKDLSTNALKAAFNVPFMVSFPISVSPSKN